MSRDILLLLLCEVLQLLHLVQLATASCSRPLGLMSGAIRDWQLSASSSYPTDKDKECHVKYARIHQPRANAWCVRHKASNEWLLVDLGVSAKVTGVITQGRGDREEWVTAFSISHSQDAHSWEFINNVYGTRRVFKANSDSYTLRHNYMEEPIEARFVRLHIVSWHRHPSMRVEIVGCQECNEIISGPPYTKMSASSHPSWVRRNSCDPDDAHINTHRSWCARHSNKHQWLQFDLGPPRLITGVLTKGRGDTKRRQWVSTYTISYSNDSVLWYFYKDDNHFDPKMFGANMDKNTERRHYLNHPFAARFVRLHPNTWYHSVAMRAGIIGCPHRGECGPGFLRVNELSQCVENLAFRKSTWVNDKRHHWKDWQFGHSELAVDGNTDNALTNCAILDNYYVDIPIWMVDLGWKEEVSGVMLVTWQGRGQGTEKVLTYRDYIFNLDRLTVYVTNKPRQEAHQLKNDTMCSYVTRMNNALFQSRLHFECSSKLSGRYVYIKASGVPNRWSRLYTTVLCEVTVY